MFKTIINAWKVKDIRTKMLYTLLLIVVYRLGSFIPVPSVNGEKLGELIALFPPFAPYGRINARSTAKNSRTQ